MKQFNYAQTKELVNTFAIRNWVDKIKITSITKDSLTNLATANIKVYGKQINSSQKYANKMFSAILTPDQLTELLAQNVFAEVPNATK